MTETLARLKGLLRRMLVRRGAALGLGFLLLVALAAAFASVLPFDPLSQSVAASLLPPSAENWFGTDELGRDILARVIYGARTSLLTAVGAVVIAALIGVPVGLAAGFYGDWRDSLLMRCIDVLLALPNILFAMALIAVLGRSQGAALIAVGIAGIPGFARIARAQVMALRQLDFVTAVRGFGGSPGYIMFRTILPNALSPLVVQAIVLASIAILLEAALAFLGVGVPPPTPSWGEMLRTGKSYLYEAPTYAVLPGIVLTLTILSLDTIGRALTAILDRDETDASGETIGGPAMTAYVLRRLFQMLPVVLIASFAIFAMIYAVPGGPVAVIVGENAGREEIAAAIQRYGLDRPMVVQYADWLGRAVTGDFGLSLHSRQPVLQLIGERLPATLQLALAAIIVALVIGIPIAIASAVKPNSWLDRLLSGWSALALGVPTFWLGILLILLFAVELRWLPSASRHVPFWESPVDALRSLALPAITLGTYVSGILARFLRASLIGEARADYVRTARAKGVPENRIVGFHIMRNALLPFVTIVGLMMANFIGGAVVTEAVFTYPGLGRLLIQAISTRDYPLIQGCILVILVAYMLINLTVDMLYAWIDPRIEYR